MITENKCRIWHYGIAQSLHIAIMTILQLWQRDTCGWNSLVLYFNVKTGYMGGKCDNKEGDKNFKQGEKTKT